MTQVLTIYCLFAWVSITPFILTKLKSNPENTFIYLFTWLLAPLTFIFVAMSSSSTKTFY